MRSGLSLRKPPLSGDGDAEATAPGRGEGKLLAAAAVLAAMHLTLVGFGAAGIRAFTPRALPASSWWSEAWGKAQEWASVYGALSGANNSYTFFAPGVPDQTRMRFLVTLPDGRVLSEGLAPGASAEADRRVNNTLASSLAMGRSVAERRRILASFAAKIFARQDGARSVDVVVEAYELPTMAAYRRGERPAWTRLLSVRYERDHDYVTDGGAAAH